MNPEVAVTLDECVDEVLGSLTGLDLSYDSRYDRYRAVTRQLNKALRQNALDHEWSYYAVDRSLGMAPAGVRSLRLPSTLRLRMQGDDAVRLVDSEGVTRVWAYFLPREAIGKYDGRRGLWASVSGRDLTFSRRLTSAEAGLEIMVPAMREPRMFALPPHPHDPEEEVPEVPETVRSQLLDFEFPDLVVDRASYYVALADPVMQPRAQTLEAEYMKAFYALAERDTRHTDSPYQNEFFVPIQASLNGTSYFDTLHPHADERY